MKDKNILIIFALLVAGMFFINYSGDFTGYYVKGESVCAFDGAQNNLFASNTINYDPDTNDGVPGKKYTDGCVNEKLAYKWTCINNGRNLYKYNVECPEGYVCDSGVRACVRGEVVEKVDDRCIDSDDGSIYVAGSVTIIGASGEGFDKKYFDICVNELSVKEYDCGDDGLKQYIQQCPLNYHCSNGRCEED